MLRFGYVAEGALRASRNNGKGGGKGNYAYTICGTPHTVVVVNLYIL